MPGTPFNVWTLPDGNPWLEFYRNGQGYHLSFPGLCDFTLSRDGSQISSQPAKNTSPHTVEHLYLNQVLPLALSRQMKLIFHASAVDINGQVAAFLGLSGKGKSTLATSFALNGHPFLTDDGLQLEQAEDGLLVRPSHGSIRLWEDSREHLIPPSFAPQPELEYTTKSRFIANDVVQYCHQPRPLGHFYFLGEGLCDRPVITPLSGRDGMVELVKNSFLLDVDQRDMLRHHFNQLTSLARLRIFFHLDYPRDFSSLVEVRNLVIAHMIGKTGRDETG